MSEFPVIIVYSGEYIVSPHAVQEWVKDHPDYLDKYGEGEVE